jgi:hypothetical protein
MDWNEIRASIKAKLLADGVAEDVAEGASFVACSAATCYAENRPYKMCAREHGCSHCDPMSQSYDTFGALN